MISFPSSWQHFTTKGCRHPPDGLRGASRSSKGTNKLRIRVLFFICTLRRLGKSTTSDTQGTPLGTWTGLSRTPDRLENTHVPLSNSTQRSHVARPRNSVCTVPSSVPEVPGVTACCVASVFSSVSARGSASEAWGRPLPNHKNASIGIETLPGELGHFRCLLGIPLHTGLA